MPAFTNANPRKQPRQARSRATVDAILNAAARILVKEGYEAASTNRVAQVAGVSVGSLYQYFPSKASLVTALRLRHANEMRTLLLAHAATGCTTTLKQSLQTLVHAAIQAHTADPKLHRVLSEEVPQPRLNGGRADFEADYLAMTKALLQSHQSALRPLNLDLACLLLHRMADALIHEIVFLPTDVFSADEIEKEIVEVAYRYLAKPAAEGACKR
ncbi:MAG: TetR/AcrR family transcriptional regulator [Pseudomonadota bacterium]